jgi:hypothetical protein
MTWNQRTSDFQFYSGPLRTDLRNDHFHPFSFDADPTLWFTLSAFAIESTGAHEEMTQLQDHLAILESLNTNISVVVPRQSSSMIRIRRILRCSIHPGPSRDDLRSDHSRLFSFSADCTFQVAQSTEAIESTGAHEEMMNS